MTATMLVSTFVSLAICSQGTPAAAVRDLPEMSAYVDRLQRERASTRSPDEQWWRRFGDRRLDGLVERGRAANYDVSVAESRVEEAEALVLQNLSPLLPTVTWDSSINTGPLDSLGFQFGASGGFDSGGGMMPMEEPPELYWQAQSVANANVEIDFTGRHVLRYEAAKSDRQAAQAEVEGQKIAITASIVQGYYDLVAARSRVRVVQEQVETNETVLELTEMRFETAQTNAMDVLQQRRQLATTRALLPQAEAQVRLFEQQLAVLLGEEPGRQFNTPDRLPELPPRPEPSSAQELMDDRPDLRAAKRRVEAAEARTKGRRRDFAPTLSVSGQGGIQAIRITEWRSQWFWGAGATLSVPLFRGMAGLAGLRQAQAQERTATNQLASQRLNALREVQDAVAREHQQVEVLAARKVAAEAATTAFEESKRRYASGLSDYLTVLTALTNAQQAELDVITAHRDLIAARIQLYQALGAG